MMARDAVAVVKASPEAPVPGAPVPGALSGAPMEE